MVKPRHDIAVLLKNTQNIAIFEPCNKAATKRSAAIQENNNFHSIFCYSFLDCHVGTTSLLAMTVFFIRIPSHATNAAQHA
ncbi:hypothetical protein [Rickettsia endosymbiont of Orchestes rusci]|uniref:hypothetical protein n=1 Tax=Rickettsia endosymbiont of Orchestes rusci TaxID=3066250 RepID=UPI00313AC29C